MRVRESVGLRVLVRVPVAEVEAVRLEVGEVVGVLDLVLLPVFVAL